jgi:hypothetical protein
MRCIFIVFFAIVFSHTISASDEFLQKQLHERANVADSCSWDAGELVFELITQRLIYLDHNLVCTLALVNKNLNNMIVQQASDRQKALQLHADSDPDQITWPSDRYVIWHTYGSACGFIAPKDKSYNVNWGNGKYKRHAEYLVQLCCLQLNTNDTIVRYVKSIADNVEYPPQLDDDDREEKYECARRFRHGMTSLMLPLFNKRGDLCTYIYDHDKEIVEHSISTYGKTAFRDAYVGYAGRVHSLVGLWINGLATPFVQSKETKESSAAIIFLASGANINGGQLSEEQYKRIDRICDVKREI